jgi:hypothetical protein
MDKADIDPDLARELDDAGADDPVEAVLLLHKGGEQILPLDAEAFVRRVCQHGERPEMNYMPRMGVLVVRASSQVIRAPQVIRALIGQPEVEIASANHLSQGLHP